MSALQPRAVEQPSARATSGIEEAGVAPAPGSNEDRSHGGRWLLAAGFALFLVGIACVAVGARAVLFGQFRGWDDEGFMLLALRTWREGGGLYDRIDTPYGPFYYSLVRGLFWALRLPLDNVGARWFVLGLWEVSAALCALYVWRLYRSFLATVATWAIAFAALSVLQNEPLHPGGIVVVLLPAMALASIGLGATRVRDRTWALLGALTAALALTKLNVGVFVGFAVAATWLRFSDRQGRRGAILVTRILLSALLFLLPFAVMRPLISKPWVLHFAVLMTASLLPFALTLLLPAEPRAWPRRAILAFAGGAVALAIASFLDCFATGSTLSGIWRCLVVDTLRFPASASLEVPLPSFATTYLSLLFVPIAFLLRAWRRPEARAGFFALRAGIALFVLYQSMVISAPFFATVPVLWLLAFPADAKRAGSHERAPAYFLALMVTLQALHVYPVAGSQIGFFGFLLPALAIVGLWDAWTELPGEWRERVPRTLARLWTVPAAAAGVWLLAGFGRIWPQFSRQWAAYTLDNVELGLPGAESLKLPELEVMVYTWLATNVRHHGDTYLGAPGLPSLHVWTGLKPPVPFYSAYWPLFYDEKRQRQLGEALLAHENPCLVRRPDVLEDWRKELSMPDSFLLRLIDEKFQVAGSAGGIELLIPKSKPVDLILTAFRTELPQGAPAEVQDCVPIRLVLPEMGGAHLVRFALVLGETGMIVADTDAPRGPARLIRADDRGMDLAAENGRPPEVLLDRRREFTLLVPPVIRKFRAGTFLVRAYDDHGRVVARLPIRR